MSDDSKVVDFSDRAKAKLEEQHLLRAAVEDALAAQKLLVDAIGHMRETVDDATVVKLLRNAIDILDGSV